MITYYTKMWYSGTGTAVVTVPINLVRLLKIQKGDLLEITIDKVGMNTDKERMKEARIEPQKPIHHALAPSAKTQIDIPEENKQKIEICVKNTDSGGK